MDIRYAEESDFENAIELSKGLGDWFNSDAIKNMKIDFKKNNLVVAVDNSVVSGFLCYTTYCGRVLILWMGTKNSYHGKGVGSYLIDWLANESKSLGIEYLEVETLPEEEDYEPYERTRKFYYKNGFKRVEYRKANMEGWDDQILLQKKI